MKYGVVLRYKFDRSWLRLSREERNKNERIFQEEIVGPFTEKVSVRHFDAEAFAAAYSDFLLIETDDLQSYYYFIEKLRDSDFIARGWADIVDIAIGVEDGYREFERDHS
jgi:hypothetical protein